MKNIVYILLLSVFGLVGCKSETIAPDDPKEPIEGNVEFGTSRAEASAMDAFVDGDQMGVYMIETAKDPAFADFKAANFVYKLNGTVWGPDDPAKMLKWKPTDDPVFFYAYAPAAKVGGAVELQSDGVSFKYTLPLDQSAQAFREYDVLHTYTKGDGNENGWSMNVANGRAIPFKFNHLLSRVSFEMYIVKENGMVVLDDKAQIVGVRISSVDLPQVGVVDVKNGLINPVVPGTRLDWKWAGNHDINVLAKGNIPADKAVTDFIVTTATMTNKGTSFAFDVKYKISESEEKNFTATYVVPSDGTVSFLAGKKTVFTAEISLSNENIEINPTIENWGDGGSHDINPIG